MVEYVVDITINSGQTADWHQRTKNCSRLLVHRMHWSHSQDWIDWAGRILHDWMEKYRCIAGRLFLLKQKFRFNYKELCVFWRLKSEKKLTNRYASQYFDKRIRLFCFDFSSPKAKTHAIFSDWKHCMSMAVVVVTFHIFIFFSRNTRPNSTKLITKHPVVKSKFVKMKNHALFQGELRVLKSNWKVVIKKKSQKPCSQISWNLCGSIPR